MAAAYTLYNVDAETIRTLGPYDLSCAYEEALRAEKKAYIKWAADHFYIGDRKIWDAAVAHLNLFRDEYKRRDLEG